MENNLVNTALNLGDKQGDGPIPNKDPKSILQQTESLKN